ncbi:MAG TPA: helix-turn-helix domain-containing protein [Candidatus Saccharimonadia bacterium]
MTNSYSESVCGVSRAMTVLGGKWTLLIIRYLLDGPRRFSELETSLGGISPRTLALRLKELEHDGILTRDCAADPAHPHYTLTQRGLQLSDIVAQMRAWGSAQELAAQP